MVECKKYGTIAGILVLLFLLGADPVFGGDLRYDLLRAKKYDEAIAECTRRISDGQGDVHDRAYSYWCRGDAYYNNGNQDKAIADFSRAIELEPTPDRYYERGETYHSMWGRSDEAVADFKTASVLYRSHDQSEDVWGFREHTAQEADRAAERSARSNFYTTFFFCAILGYALGRCFRKPTPECNDRRSAIRSWTILIASVSVFPYVAVQILSKLGWSSPFIRFFGSTFGILFCVAIVGGLLSIIVVPMALAWDARKARKQAAIASAQSAAPRAEVAGDPARKASPKDKHKYCSSCGVAVVEEEGVRFCHICGAPLDKREARREND